MRVKSKIRQTRLQGQESEWRLLFLMIEWKGRKEILWDTGNDLNWDRAVNYTSVRICHRTANLKSVHFIGYNYASTNKRPPIRTLDLISKRGSTDSHRQC